MIGDLQNHIEILRKNLKKIKYPHYQPNQLINQLKDENPEIFLQFLHFVIIDFDPEFYKQMLEKGYEMFSKNDLRFMEFTYKFLVKEYRYKPSLSLTQFFTNQYLEHKIMLFNDICDIIYDFYSENKQKQQKQQQKLQQLEDKEKEKNIDSILFQPYQQQKNQQQQQCEDDNDFDDEQPLSAPQPTIHMNQNEMKPKNNKSQQQQKQQLPMVNVENNQSQNQQNQNEDQQKKQQMNEYDGQDFQEKMIQNTLKDMNQFDNFFQQKINNFDQQGQSMQKISDLSLKSQQQQQQQNLQNQMQSNQQQIQQENKDKQQNQQQQFQNLQQQQINQQQVQQTQQQQLQKQGDKPVTRQELKEVMKLMVEMNTNINVMMKNFEGFKNEVNGWISNTNAQVVLLDNQVKILKAQNSNKNSNDNNQQQQQNQQ